MTAKPEPPEQAWTTAKSAHNPSLRSRIKSILHLPHLQLGQGASRYLPTLVSDTKGSLWWLYVGVVLRGKECFFLNKGEKKFNNNNNSNSSLARKIITKKPQHRNCKNKHPQDYEQGKKKNPFRIFAGIPEPSGADPPLAHRRPQPGRAARGRRARASPGPRGCPRGGAAGAGRALTVAEATLLSARVKWCGSHRRRNLEVRILLRNVRGCRMTHTWMSPSCSSLYLMPLQWSRALRHGAAPILFPSGADISPSSGLLSSGCLRSLPPPEPPVRSMAAPRAGSGVALGRPRGPVSTAGRDGHDQRK